MPPIPAASVPTRVIPIWTSERKFSGFSRIRRRVSAFFSLPSLTISLILLFLAEIMANSPREKSPFSTISEMMIDIDQIDYQARDF